MATIMATPIATPTIKNRLCSGRRQAWRQASRSKELIAIYFSYPLTRSCVSRHAWSLTKCPWSRCNTRSAMRATSGACVAIKSVLPASRVSSSSSVEHGVPGVLVQVAGRLVGQDQQRVVRQRTGNGHALLLAARQLVGIGVDPIAQAHAIEQPLGMPARIARACPSIQAAASRFPAPSASGSG